VGINMKNQENTKINTGEGAPQAPKENESAETPVKADIEQQTPFRPNFAPEGDIHPGRRKTVPGKLEHTRV
jgi:hypothetical protein